MKGINLQYNNYFLGHCPEGVTHVYGNQQLIVPDLYENIDILYSSNQNGIKYYFIIKPGGDPADIEIVYTGADSLKIDASTNDFTIFSSVGNLIYERPTVYQVDANNDIVNINGWTADWQFKTSTCLNFNIGSYNTSLPLIIQVDLGHAQHQATQAIGNLLWSTYYGGSGTTEFMDICNDNNNFTYITGCANYPNFPTPTGYSVYSHAGDYDAIVVKLDNELEQKWVSYIGGRLGSTYYYQGNPETNLPRDVSYAITINPSDYSIYIAGKTLSIDFPLNDNGGQYAIIDDDNLCSLEDYADIFITHLKSTGDIIWSTYYGNDEAECIYDLVMVDQVLYCVGYRSASTDIVPLTGATNYQSGNGLIMRLTNNVLQWANPFDVSRIRSICNDNSGNVYITGVTTSSTTPVLNNDNNVQCTSSLNGIGTTDAFISMFNNNGVLQYSMYYGSVCNDVAFSAVTNSNRKVFVAGVVNDNHVCNYIGSYTLPLIPSSNQVFDNTTDGTPEAFIFSIEPYSSGNASISYSSYFGGGGGEGSSPYNHEFSVSLAVDNEDYVYMAGLTNSSTDINVDPIIPFPQSNAPSLYVKDDIQNINNPLRYDSYIASFSPQMEIVWTTYFGGFQLDKATSISIRPDQKLMFIGITYSRNDYCPSGETLLELVNYNEYSFDDYYQYITGPYYPAWAAMFDVSTIPYIGINQNKVSDHILNICPNPVSDDLFLYWKNNVSNNRTKSLHYQIIDDIGKIVDSGSISNIPANISIRGFKDGLYSLKLLYNNKYECHKFVIKK